MILDDIRVFLRKRALLKYTSKTPTSILPLDEIRSAIAIIDVQDPYFDTCKGALMAFFRDNGIKGEIYFLDLRKIEKEERLFTSVSTTILLKDLNWYGRPSSEKIRLLTGSPTDALICLIPDTEFLTEFIAKCTTARYKIGRVQLPGNTFDLVISDPEDKPLSQRESFEAMKPFIKLIKRDKA